MSVQFASAKRPRAFILTCLLAATVVPPLGSIAQAATMTTISGSPVKTTVAGNRYAFTPNASGTGTKRFSIVNRPGWASFSSSTGALTGRPGNEHVGRSYANIKISVLIGKSSATLPAFSIVVKSSGASSGTPNPAPNPVQNPAPGVKVPASITLSWRPPTENNDGTTLTNLAGYNIYSGTTAGNLSKRLVVSNPGLTRYVIESLKAGERFFAVAAVSTKGIESTLSRVVELE